MLRNCNVRNTKSALKYSNHTRKIKLSRNKKTNCEKVSNVNWLYLQFTLNNSDVTVASFFHFDKVGFIWKLSTNLFYSKSKGGNADLILS